MTKITLFIAFLIVSTVNISNADNKYYKCLKIEKSPAPNGQVFYSIKAETKNEGTQLLQQGHAKNAEEAEQMRKDLAQQYGITENSCMPTFHE